MASRGAIKQQKAKEKLNFYEETYAPRSDPVRRDIPKGNNSFIKPKTTTNPETLAALTVGDMNKVKSFIDLRCIRTPTSTFINGHGNDIRTFSRVS